MENEDRKKITHWKKILLRIAGVVAGCLLFLAVLLIGTVQERKVGAQPSAEENLHVMNVVSKLSNSLFTKDGKIAAKSTVELTSAEVNAILATGIRAYQLKHSGARDAVLFGELKDGRIRLYGSLPFLGKLAINARAAVIPSVSGKKLKLNFSGLRVGWLPLSGWLADRITERLLAEVETVPEYQRAMNVILDLKINTGGNLELTFIPGKIAVLLTPLLQR